jgi:glycolate oxidase iron-sulfur subunit
VSLDARRDEDLRRCIHCGLCLEACPTYPLRGLEGESPRGRILLLRSLSEGTFDPGADVFDPLRSCLGCGACEPACPSGVRYLDLLRDGHGAWHAEIDRTLPPALRVAKDLFLHHLLPRTRLLRMLEAVSGALGRIRVWERLVEGRMARESSPGGRAVRALLPSRSFRERPAEAGAAARTEASGDPAQIFRGCVAPILLPGVEPAARALLAAAGYRVETPAAQGCCGALTMHYGDPEVARACARRNVEAFDATAGPIVVTAAGCSAALREADRWLGPGDPRREAARRVAGRVRDLSVVLAERGERLRWRSPGRRVAVQDPCHLKHVQGIVDPPRVLLRGVPGVDLVEAGGTPNCCGSAGLYSFLHPEFGRTLGEQTLAGLTVGGVDWIVTSNPGCLLHLRMLARREGRPVEILHIAEALALLLDRATGRRDP